MPDIIMKIKAHIAFLLSFLILVSNVGMAFNVHYCEGKISGVSFNYKTEEPCIEEKPCVVEKSCCAKQDTHDECCKNDKVDIKKTASDNVLVKNFQLDLASFIPAQEYNFSQFVVLKEFVQKSENPSFYCDTNAPPLYKLYSQYIFYA